MGSFKLNETDKTYDSELDTWIDSQGRIFIKNCFDPSKPSFIDITTDYWGIDNSGQYIDWIKLDLPKNIELAFKKATRKKLKHVSPGYISKCRLMLAEFKAELNPQHLSLTDLTMSDVNVIWQKMTPDYRCFFRELYTYLANQNIGGASKVIALKLKQMHARSDTRNLNYVLNWHATKGALTQDEELLLRDAIENPPRNENVENFGIRLFCWLLITTLKRSKQIRELKRECLSTVSNNGVTEYFVQVKPVKNQTGDPYRWWPIPKELYHEMQVYSSIHSVLVLQHKFDRFWVMDCPALYRVNSVSAADAKSALSNYMALELISNRTQKPLHITPNRIGC